MPSESNRDDLARIIFTANGGPLADVGDDLRWHPRLVPGQGRRGDGGGLAEGWGGSVRHGS
jgi:hypothetical protein